MISWHEGEKRNSSYRDYLFSKEWQQKRDEQLKKDDFRCQRCGTAKNLRVHHIRYESAGDEKLITLCDKCHAEIHDEDIKRKRARSIFCQ